MEAEKGSLEEEDPLGGGGDCREAPGNSLNKDRKRSELVSEE